MRLFQTLAVSLGCVFSLSLASKAMADCDEMENSEWNALSTKMAIAYDSGNFEEALNYGKRLNLICSRSPIVNYTMSEIYAHMGDEQKAVSYSKKATDYILDYQIPQALNEKIWMRRAEYELPYKKEAEALRLQMADYEKLKAENEAMVQDNNKRLSTVESQAKEERLKGIIEAQERRSRWNAALWSGVGVTVVGIAVAVGGGVMTTKVDKVSYSPTSDPEKSGFSVTPSYVASWTMLGAGTTVAVLGSILVGIAAHKVATIEVGDENAPDRSVSLNLAPGAVQFGMTF